MGCHWSSRCYYTLPPNSHPEEILPELPSLVCSTSCRGRRCVHKSVFACLVVYVLLPEVNAVSPAIYVSDPIALTDEPWESRDSDEITVVAALAPISPPEPAHLADGPNFDAHARAILIERNAEAFREYLLQEIRYSVAL